MAPGGPTSVLIREETSSSFVYALLSHFPPLLLFFLEGFIQFNNFCLPGGTSTKKVTNGHRPRCVSPRLYLLLLLLSSWYLFIDVVLRRPAGSHLISNLPRPPPLHRSHGSFSALPGFSAAKNRTRRAATCYCTRRRRNGPTAASIFLQN